MNTASRTPQSTGDRPFLVTQGPVRKIRLRPLVSWHLFSLDAPTVAAVWTAFAAWCADVRIASTDSMAMFLAVWILYAADRLLDAKPLFQSPFLPEIAERHRFHNAHRARFVTAIVVATIPLMLLLHRTPDAVLHMYVLLACLLGAWLLLVHARHASPASPHRLPKELAVGIFFPAAVWIPTVTRAPAERLSVLPQALAFAGCCTLNCLFLYVWEHPGNPVQAHATTRWGIRHLHALAICFAVLTSVAAALCWMPLHRPDVPGALLLPHASFAFAACASSGVLLLVLHRVRDRFTRTSIRALADLVLLTPVPFYFAAQMLLGR